MKNKKRILVISIIFVILIIIFAILFNKNKEQFIKNEKTSSQKMTDTTRITELEKQISNLNIEQKSYAEYVQKGKEKIAQAITNQGVSTTPDVTFDVMSENISKILQERTSDATATADRILKGYTAYKNNELVTGTMENYAGKTVAASNTNSDDSNVYLTIPDSGYYDTNSKIVTKKNNTVAGLETLTISNQESSKGDTYTSITRTYTKDTICGIAYHSTGTNPTIKKNGEIINCSFWNFGLYPNPTTLIPVKAGDIIYAEISGPRKEFDYQYFMIGDFGLGGT